MISELCSSNRRVRNSHVGGNGFLKYPRMNTTGALAVRAVFINLWTEMSPLTKAVNDVCYAMSTANLVVIFCFENVANALSASSEVALDNERAGCKILFSPQPYINFTEKPERHFDYLRYVSINMRRR